MRTFTQSLVMAPFMGPSRLRVSHPQVMHSPQQGWPLGEMGVAPTRTHKWCPYTVVESCTTILGLSRLRVTHPRVMHSPQRGWPLGEMGAAQRGPINGAPTMWPSGRDMGGKGT